ncbi:MAG TPA: hypothetical protein VJB13_01350 [Candidatus Nanoarchaeia archaeon]|nr:hypothetical protein [Candidatus Nanoarchaeia archaeon]
MSQELSDIIEGVIAIGSPGIFLAATLIPYFSYVLSYRDTKRYFSLTDESRQQKLGKPKFSKILLEDIKNFPSLFGAKFDFSYSTRYFSAYLETIREKEETKYLNYRKIREE